MKESGQEQREKLSTKKLECAKQKNLFFYVLHKSQRQLADV